MYHFQTKYKSLRRLTQKLTILEQVQKKMEIKTKKQVQMMFTDLIFWLYGLSLFCMTVGNKTVNV